ncbi:MAG TPA: homoserine kinase [Gemmatimonadaceae bacterium]
MTPATISRATVRVPASSSNLGAGFDCVGVAIDRWLRVSAEIRDDGRADVHIRRKGTLRALDLTGPSDVRDDLIYTGFKAVLNGCSGNDGFTGSVHFDADSDIPIARGLGSSAAALLAGAALANATLGLLLSVDELAQICSSIEGHGDNVGAAALGGAVLVAPSSQGAYFAPLPVHDSLAFAFAIPEFETRTELARAALPREVPFTTAVSAAARSASLVQGLQTADGRLLAAGLDDVLHVPHRKPFVRDYDRVIQSAHSAGAFGATLSGSGSAIVAIAPRAIAATVATAMAESWCAAGVTARGFATGVCHAGLSVVSPPHNFSASHSPTPRSVVCQ